MLTVYFLNSMDAQNASFMTEFASCWGLLMGSLVIAAPIIFFKVKEHTDVDGDLQFSDETPMEVLGADTADKDQLDSQPACENESVTVK